MLPPSFRRRARRVVTAAAVAAVVACPTTAGAVAPHGPVAPDPAAHEPLARYTAVVGWAPTEERTVGTPWTDGVAISPGLGRDVELQQLVDGAWMTRRSFPTGAGTWAAAVGLTGHWTQAPVTRWRLFVAGTADAAPATSGVKVVHASWEAGTDPADPTVLVTKDRAISPQGYRPGRLVEPDLATQGAWTELRPAAAKALGELAADAQDATGERLVLVSGFRPAGYQERLFDRYAARHGERAASRFSARSGHSEHQTGWAADVTQAGVPFTDFGGTPSSDWVDRHAWRYGYVVRYPRGAEDVTGYRGEPWHLRYVGTHLAAYLHHGGGTLEEAFGLSG
ncbi:D-alanyl-D-alanine carboxypeptidase family protein [Isoptericola chiayiensis]|uniref:D-alanyl-D-alanine carboxypeptidase family protein n=1 Tax=Isoptericola chiayiensis TaxID=579446 RepID=UPI001553D34D|nr:D-alanyl-D-alanine carboxypeptidase [Isoptericola chiayiensis]